jgi:hypothetical protein
MRTKIIPSSTQPQLTTSTTREGYMIPAIKTQEENKELITGSKDPPQWFSNLQYMLHSRM